MRQLKQFFLSRALLGLLVISFAFAIPISAFGEDPASFYKGKTLNFLVGLSPGGGYDLYARMVAPFLEKETGATVVVRNMTGGQEYVALRALYTAKPDGLNIFIVGGTTVVLNQLFGDPKAKGMDMRKVNWLCRLTYDPCVLLLSAKYPYRTIADLKSAKQPITAGTAAALSNQHVAMAFLAEALGLDAKMVVGYSGSKEQALAAMRGELTSLMISAGSALEFAKQPELLPLVTVSLEKTRLFPKLPSISDLVTLSPEQVKWFQKQDKILGIGRPILATPGTPQERVQFLSRALDKVLHNKDLLAVADQTQRTIDYLSGQEVQKLSNDLLTMSESEQSELKNAFDRHIMKSLSK